MLLTDISLPGCRPDFQGTLNRLSVAVTAAYRFNWILISLFLFLFAQ
jgi:hypothetical protein